MTAAQVFELATRGGMRDFARLVSTCEDAGPYCLMGGLAVDAFTDPVFALDVEMVVGSGFRGVSGFRPVSQLRIQFTTDPRYQSFLARSLDAEVLGVHVRIACLEDVTQGKLWAYGDPSRRLSKRKKDELDLIRLAEKYPELKAGYPQELRDLIERG